MYTKKALINLSTNHCVCNVSVSQSTLAEIQRSEFCPTDLGMYLLLEFPSGTQQTSSLSTPGVFF